MHNLKNNYVYTASTYFTSMLVKFLNCYTCIEFENNKSISTKIAILNELSKSNTLHRNKIKYLTTFF